MPERQQFRRSVVARGLETEAPRHLYEFREGFRVHLAHDATSVRLHGDLADPELSAHLFVQLTANHQCHYFLLATGKRSVPLPKHLEARLLFKICTTALKCALEGAQEHFGGVGLGEE